MVEKVKLELVSTSAPRHNEQQTLISHLSVVCNFAALDAQRLCSPPSQTSPDHPLDKKRLALTRSKIQLSALFFQPSGS